MLVSDFFKHNSEKNCQRFKVQHLYKKNELTILRLKNMHRLFKQCVRINDRKNAFVLYSKHEVLTAKDNNRKYQKYPRHLLGNVIKISAQSEHILVFTFKGTATQKLCASQAT
jgi:hypothetical protein